MYVCIYITDICVCNISEICNNCLLDLVILFPKRPYPPLCACASLAEHQKGCSGQRMLSLFWRLKSETKIAVGLLSS